MIEYVPLIFYCISFSTQVFRQSQVPLEKMVRRHCHACRKTVHEPRTEPNVMACASGNLYPVVGGLMR